MKATRLMVAGAMLLGCHAKNDERQTTFVTRSHVLDEFITASCSQRTFTREMSDRASPESTRREYGARCLPKPELGASAWLHLRWVSNIAETADGVEICRVVIGPDPIRVRINPEFIVSMFRDPDKQAKARRLFADNNDALSKELKLVADVDGISLHVDQYNSVDGPELVVELDGCERAGRSDTSVDAGAPLAFAKP